MCRHTTRRRDVGEVGASSRLLSDRLPEQSKSTAHHLKLCYGVMVSPGRSRKIRFFSYNSPFERAKSSGCRISDMCKSVLAAINLLLIRSGSSWASRCLTTARRGSAE